MYVDKATLEDGQPGGYAELKSLVDIGDILGASGRMKRTDKGELSVMAHSLTVLTKSLLPLPDKFHGLMDVEKRYRQRCALPGSHGDVHRDPERQHSRFTFSAVPYQVS